MARLQISKANREKTKEKKSTRKNINDYIPFFSATAFVLGVAGLMLSFGSSPSLSSAQDEGYTQVDEVSIEKINKTPGDLRLDTEEYLSEHDEDEETMIFMTAYADGGEAVLLGYSSDEEELHEISVLDELSKTQLDVEGKE